MSHISVVMAVYNGEQFLCQQIWSVLHELMPGDELIIIDDASTDASPDLLRSISSPAIKIHTNPTNLGVMQSFERGLKIAKHEFIFLCDQDDLWLPGKRAAFIDAFERDPKVLVVISDAQVIDAQGQIASQSFMATRGEFNGSFCATIWRNRYLGCAMAFRNLLLKAALPFPSQIPMHDMWLGILASLKGKVTFLPAPLLQYRRHGGNISPSHRQPLKRMLRWRMALLVALIVRLALLKFRFQLTR